MAGLLLHVKSVLRSLDAVTSAGGRVADGGQIGGELRYRARVEAPASFDDAPRVVIVAGDPLVRSGLASLAEEAGAEVLGTAALDAVGPILDAVPVDLLVVDVALEAELTALVGAPAPCVAMVADPATARGAVEAGVPAVIARTSGPEQLWAAIVAVLADLRVLDPGLVPDLFGPTVGTLNDPEAQARAHAEAAAAAGVDLTDREQEVLGLMGQGLSNREIGEALEISANTAKFHVKAVLDKLGAQTRTEAVVLALRAGLLEL